MSHPLRPAEIFKLAAEEGRRRLDQNLMQLLATGFIAGFTIIFGVAAQGIVHSLSEPHFGEFATVLGALAFGVGVVFLVLGRAELFSENFSDPVAVAFQGPAPNIVQRMLRLWALTFLLNLIGGAILIIVLSVEGALAPGASESIRAVAVEIVEREPLATFSRSIVGGALVAMLSFLVAAAQDSVTRAMAGYVVGVLLALGPFEHVVVAFLHMGFGLALGAEFGMIRFAEITGISLLGNLIGGVLLVTVPHAAQAHSEKKG